MSLLAEAATNLPLWKDYLEVLLDPAHIGAEFTFTLVFDGLAIGLLWPLIKRNIKKLRKDIHKELDKEHGIEHNEEWL